MINRSESWCIEKELDRYTNMLVYFTFNLLRMNVKLSVLNSCFNLHSHVKIRWLSSETKFITNDSIRIGFIWELDVLHIFDKQSAQIIWIFEWLLSLCLKTPQIQVLNESQVMLNFHFVCIDSYIPYDSTRDFISFAKFECKSFFENDTICTIIIIIHPLIFPFSNHV